MCSLIWTTTIRSVQITSFSTQYHLIVIKSIANSILNSTTLATTLTMGIFTNKTAITTTLGVCFLTTMNRCWTFQSRMNDAIKTTINIRIFLNSRWNRRNTFIQWRRRKTTKKFWKTNVVTLIKTLLNKWILIVWVNVNHNSFRNSHIVWTCRRISQKNSPTKLCGKRTNKNTSF